MKTALLSSYFDEVNWWVWGTAQVVRTQCAGALMRVLPARQHMSHASTVQPHMRSLPMMLVFRFLCPGFLFRLNSHIGEHFWTHQSAIGVNSSGPPLFSRRDPISSGFNPEAPVSLVATVTEAGAHMGIVINF